MNIKLGFAIFAINSALIFYTIGVFSERRAKLLKQSHVVIFWIGLIFDVLGTTTMGIIARSQGTSQSQGVIQSIHAITGVLAIGLMLFHASWATWVDYRNDISMKKVFHKFSIFVWGIWLIPYIIGMVIGMVK